MSEESGSSRPRLNLKPRDENAARQLEIQRTASGKNPFGDAKPREAILASRTGKSETDIVKEEVKSEKPKLRLNAQQLEEKRAAEAAVAEIEELLAAEENDAQKGPLKEELQARRAQLDELIAGFEKLAVEAAIKGEFVRPSERRRQQLETQGSGNGYGTGDPRGDAAGYGRNPEGGYQRGPGSYGSRPGYREGGSYREGGGSGFRDGGSFNRDRMKEPGSAGRDGGFGGDRRSGGFDRGYGGRGGGSRGFSNYEERPLDDEGGRRSGSFQERGGGGGGGGYYDRDGGREYRGPSDYDNVETFGTGAAGYGRDRNRGGGRGGGGRGRSDRPFNSFGSGGFGAVGADDDYISPYSSEAQDRY